MTAGYSEKSLAKKLGIKEGSRIIFLNAPVNYENEIGEFNFPVTIEKNLKNDMDFIQIFVKEKSEFKSVITKLLNAINENGMIWISWPKKSSKVQTDITEERLREIALPLGLVDIKVIAVNEIWSGLKFVKRKSIRKK